MIYMALASADELDRLIATWAAPQDQEVALNYNSANRKRNFLAGRAGLRALLNKVTGKTDWKICIAPGGKPYLIIPDDRPCPHISISHTQGMIACAVSLAGEVGIDIEFWRLRDFEAVAGYAFDAKGCDIVARDGSAGFYRLWTLKEALAKAQGKSIFQVLNKDDGLINSSSPDVWQAGEWGCFSTIPTENYSLSCVARTDAPAQFTLLRLLG